MASADIPGWIPPPGWNGYPLADARCRTCRHQKRDLIEALLDAGVCSPTIARMLNNLGFWAPGEDSLRNHHRRHRQADPEAVRRAQAQLRLAEMDWKARRTRPSAMNLADALQMAAATLPDAPPMPGASPADQPLVLA